MVRGYNGTLGRWLSSLSFCAFAQSLMIELRCVFIICTHPGIHLWTTDYVSRQVMIACKNFLLHRIGINWEERKSLPLATKKPLSRGCRSWGPDRRPSQLFRLSIFWVSLSALQLSGQNVQRIVERTDILRQAFDNRLSFDKHLWKLGPERKVIIVFKIKLHKICVLNLLYNIFSTL